MASLIHGPRQRNLVALISDSRGNKSPTAKQLCATYDINDIKAEVKTKKRNRTDATPRILMPF